MVHSTGANNPYVSRYVPGNDSIGFNSGNNHWNKSGISKCVHAFLGKFVDGSIGIVQTLPLNYRGWHCASGKNGSGNDTHISFEICEDGLDDEEYFSSVYDKAVEFTAYLCNEYNLDPMADGVVICHQEGYKSGIASNHADVLHWFTKFGKTMDDFREDVNNAMEDENMTQEKFNEMMENYLIEKSKLNSTMPDLLGEAKSMGLTNGASPRTFVTREECAIMARAAALYKGDK